MMNVLIVGEDTLYLRGIVSLLKSHLVYIRLIHTEEDLQGFDTGEYFDFAILVVDKPSGWVTDFSKIFGGILKSGTLILYKSQPYIDDHNLANLYPDLIFARGINDEELVNCIKDITAEVIKRNSTSEEDPRHDIRIDRNIMELISRGYTSAEIANNLRRSVRTIENRRKKIMNRFGVRNTAELVRFAIESGIIQLEKKQAV